MIYLASDHAGFELKKHLASFIVTNLKKEVTDLGPAVKTEEDDYPDYAVLVTNKLKTEPNSVGILVCGTGHGMCMTANKAKGMRAILGYSIEAAEMGRKDENANVLCLAGRVLSVEHAGAIVKKFLETEFKGEERHQRRLNKVAAIN